jgi:hypothetical protein
MRILGGQAPTLPADRATADSQAAASLRTYTIRIRALTDFFSNPRSCGGSPGGIPQGIPRGDPPRVPRLIGGVSGVSLPAPTRPSNPRPCQTPTLRGPLDQRAPEHPPSLWGARGAPTNGILHEMLSPLRSPPCPPWANPRISKCMLGDRAAGDGSMHLSILGWAQGRHHWGIAGGLETQHQVGWYDNPLGTPRMGNAILHCWCGGGSPHIALFCVVGSYRGLVQGVAGPPRIIRGRPFTPGKPPGFHPPDLRIR